MVIREALVLASIGAAVGMAGALVLSRFIEATLFGVTPTDTTTFATVLLVIFGATFLATVLPAQRAVSVDPAVVLRAN